MKLVLSEEEIENIISQHLLDKGYGVNSVRLFIISEEDVDTYTEVYIELNSLDVVTETSIDVSKP